MWRQAAELCGPGVHGGPAGGPGEEGRGRAGAHRAALDGQLALAHEPASAPGAPDTVHSWVGIIMYLPTEDAGQRGAITDACATVSEGLGFQVQGLGPTARRCPCWPRWA